MLHIQLIPKGVMSSQQHLHDQKHNQKHDQERSCCEAITAIQLRSLALFGTVVKMGIFMTLAYKWGKLGMNLLIPLYEICSLANPWLNDIHYLERYLMRVCGPIQKDE